MSLPILQPSTYETTHVRGDVTVDSSAMIAVGVILNATPGNKIVIHGGVCLGMGTVITAYDGDIEIKSNAILGAGCLIFGHCVVGSQASLGASVTIYNINVNTGDVIPAGSIRGDRTRQIEVNTDQERQEAKGNRQEEFLKDSNDSKSENQSYTNTSQNKENKQEIVDSQEKEENQDNNTSQEIKSEKEDNIPDKKDKSTSDEQLKEDVWQEETPPSSDQVVGKVYINKLLFTLFPERNM